MKLNPVFFRELARDVGIAIAWITGVVSIAALVSWLMKIIIEGSIVAGLCMMALCVVGMATIICWGQLKQRGHSPFGGGE